MKDHERVGQSFQNQQPQNQELAAELEEQEKDAEELANLVQTKSEAIKTLQTKLVDAKRTIAELKAELKTLCQHSADEPQQQPQQKDATNVISICMLLDYVCYRTQNVWFKSKYSIIDLKPKMSARNQ